MPQGPTRRPGRLLPLRAETMRQRVVRLLGTAVLPRVEALLARDRLRPVDLFEAVRTRRVRPEEMAAADSDLLTLRNLNTREEYEAALALAGLD